MSPTPLLLCLLLVTVVLLTVLVRRRRRAERAAADPSPAPPSPGSFLAPAQAPSPPTPRTVGTDVPGRTDQTSRHYTELSRSLAEAGRVHEAALAQWAADLRLLAPLIDGREADLEAAVAALDPTDPFSMVTAARSAAVAVTGESVSWGVLLADCSHLRVGDAHADRPAYVEQDVSPDVLDDRVLAALETVLVEAAERGRDDHQVTVGLRCDLIAQVVAGRPAPEAVGLVRGVLAPHERSAFDTAVAR